MRTIQIAGKRYGRLTVTGIADRKTKGGELIWRCVCDCGSVTETTGTNLRRGATKSCGCLRNEILSNRHSGKDKGVGGFRKLCYSYRWWARKRNLCWELDEIQCQKLFKGDCYYCGNQPSQISRAGSDQSEYIYNGLDRTDNSIGYITSNVVSCCGMCNYAKKGKTTEEFWLWAQRIGARLLTIKETP